MALPKITSNSPAAGSISWTASSISYGGVVYTIPAGNTAAKYVVWKYNSGAPSLVASSTFPSLTPDDTLLFLNKDGVGVLAPMASVTDGSLIVPESILAESIGADQIVGEHIRAGSVEAEHVAAHAITVDKLSVGSVSDNLVVNGSFEDFDAQGFPLGWEATAISGGSIGVVSGVASSGSKAVRLQATSTTSNLRFRQDPSRYIPVSLGTGRRWFVSASWGAGTATTKGAYLRVHWFDANKVALPSPNTSVDIVSNQPLTTSFKEVYGQATPPAAARYMAVELLLVSPSVATSMYVDEVVAREVIVSAAIGDGAITAPKITASEEMWAKVLGAHKITALEINTDNLAANNAFVSSMEANIITSDVFQGKEFTGGTFRGGLFETLADVGTSRRGIKIDGELNALLAFDSTGENTFLLDGATGDFSAVGEYATKNTNPNGITARGILGTSTMIGSMDGVEYNIPALRFEYEDPDLASYPMIRSDYRTNVALISGSRQANPDHISRLDFDYYSLNGYINNDNAQGGSTANLNLYAETDPVDQQPRWAAGGLLGSVFDFADNSLNTDAGIQYQVDKLDLNNHAQTYARFGIGDYPFNKGTLRFFGDGVGELATANELYVSGGGGLYNGWNRDAGRLDYTGNDLDVRSLHGVTVPGVYHQDANAKATAELGYPTDAAGLLEVFKSNTSSMIYQRYTCYKDRQRIFQRGAYTGTWGPWQEIAVTTPWVDIPKASGMLASDSPQVRRIGGLAYLQGAVRPSSGNFASGYTRLGTIPVGFRPGGWVYAPAVMQQPSTPAKLTIKNDGTLELHAQDSNSSYTVLYHVSYPLPD